MGVRTYAFPEEVGVDGCHDFPLRLVEGVVVCEYGISLGLVDEWLGEI